MNNFSSYLTLLASLVFFSILGTLIRLLLTLLLHSADKTNNIVTIYTVDSSSLANIFGTFLLGCWLPFQQRYLIPDFIHIGIATALCGGITTFAGWQSASNLLFISGNIFDGLFSLLFIYCTLYLTLTCGMHLSTFLLALPSLSIAQPHTGKLSNGSKSQLEQDLDHSEKKDLSLELLEDRDQPISSSVLSPFYSISPSSDASQKPQWDMKRIIQIGLLVLAPTCWVLTICLTILIPKARPWTYPCTLAPFGTILRWIASRWNTSPTFKLGTFSVNFIGTILYGILFILHYYTTTAIQMQTIGSLLLGFLGGLTTASQFINEVQNQCQSKAAIYIYPMTSVVASQATLFIIYGTYFGITKKPALTI